MKAKAYIVHRAMREPELEWSKPKDCLSADRLYTTPPQRKPLTDEQIEDCIDSANRGFNGRRRGPSGQQVTTYDDWKHWLARAIETAHGIKE